MVKRVAYAFILVMVMALLGGFSGHLVAGQVGTGTPSATVTVTAVPGFIYSPGGGGGGEGEGGGLTARFLTVDMLHEITRAQIKSDGILLESYVIAAPSDNVILGLDSGTKIICSDNQVPERLEIRLSEEPLPVPEGMAAVSPIYNLTAYVSGGAPQPVTFDPPIILQISYSPEELPENVLSVFIAYHDEEEGWTHLEAPSGFVAAVGTAGAQVSHFAPFAVMADLATPPLPACFEIRSLDINPNQVMAGESITISAQLVNIGGLIGEHTLMVNIEGLLETSQVVELAPGQSREVSFTVTPGSPGSYRVEIDDSLGNFVVRAIPTPSPTPAPVVPTPPGPAAETGGYGWLIATVSAVAIAALAFITLRKRLRPALAALASIIVRKGLQRAPVIGKLLKPAPVAFRVSSLKIIPSRVKPDRSVTIISEATNTGPVTGSYSLVLKIKGVVEAVKEITLAPGQSQKVAFAIFKDKAGVYDVDLEGLKGSFTVEE